MGRHKKYFTEEERKAAHRENQRKYRETNPEYARKYRETPMGRASYLLNGYRAMDINKGFGDVIDFDAQWIVDNIFNQKCAHCEESDWHKLGCNRINNDLPHIKSNVEPCCWKHNHELAKPYLAERLSIPIAQYDKVTGELVAVWESSMEIERKLGFDQGNINACCNGRYKSAYGSVWRKISKEEYEMLRACFE